ncbi:MULTISPECIES: hypothetical protein [Streptomyces]|uniref:DUF3592 domain-containing protein n=1 Tax=Streptomyces glycanivorans TaxID=3033808 RepID=A0ABY9JGW4_9ACTN|nr:MULTISPECIES: hypothetical protein [unclassified Streptomyces]WLQ65292.1 hypothetical protein P8A20_17600 [Streptomyces sp. Alt3]WSQ86067.1 hypothetical protein OG722_17620 [Streptomyces sp. NBC_01212]WSR07857.1 hypothetical protein OG265_18465 [Streptomyces sp. NBC_01208]
MTPTGAAPSRRPRKNRPATRGAAVFGAVCLLVAAWLLLVGTPGALADERDFRAAVACPPGAQGTRGADCLRTAAAHIDRADEVQGRKTPTYWLYLTESDGTSSRTRLHGSPREAPLAEPGTKVEVTYWRSQIRYVDFSSTRLSTNADPRGDYRLLCSLGLGLAFYGTAFLWGWYWMSRRSPPTLRAYPWQAAVTTTGALLLTLLGAVAPWFTGSIQAAFRLVASGTVVVLIACLTAAVVLKRRQHGDDTIGLTPAVPIEEEVIGGRVLGSTPYADSGGGFLVVGPGYLASTPDPTGSAYRREVPDTLTPVRVRPPYTTDPADRPDYGGRALVLECEDNGEEVLVVTRNKHMPTILGALRHPRTDGPALP